MRRSSSCLLFPPVFRAISLWSLIVVIVSPAVIQANEEGLYSAASSHVNTVDSGDENSWNGGRPNHDDSMFQDNSFLQQHDSIKDPDCSDPNRNRLACWLWHIKIDIPNQSFTEYHLTLSIKNMDCKYFQLKHLDADYSQPQILDVSASDITATCKGSYHLTGGIGGDVQVSIEGRKDAIKVEFEIRSNQNLIVKKPDKFTTKSCHTDLIAHGIHFTGSISARVIQMFAKTIGGYITQALHDNVCPLLPQKLDPLMTNYMTQFDKWSEQYLPQTATARTATTSSSQIATSRRTASRIETTTKILLQHEQVRHGQGHLRSSLVDDDYHIHEGTMIVDDQSKNASSVAVYPQEYPMVKWVLELVNDQLQQHLQQGWFFHYNDVDKYNLPKDCHNMFRGISGWVVSLLGEEIDIVLPNWFHNFTIPNMPLGATCSLSIHRLFVQGLDLLDTFQVLLPNDDDDENGDNSQSNHHGPRLESKLSTQQGLHIGVPMNVVFQLPHATHRLEESLTVHVNITQMETMLTTLIQVMDWDSTSVLQVVDAIQNYIDTKNWRSVSCLVRTVNTTKLTNWATTILLESLSLSRQSTGTVEDDIDNVINAALDLTTTEYATLWTQLLKGLIDGPGRRALERFITKWVNDHKSIHPCAPPSNESKPKWLNFTKLDLLYTMNEYFNHQHTRKTMNHFMSCVGQLTVEKAIANATSGNAMISNMETKNWDQLSDFVLLEPSRDKPNVLTSHIEWGNQQKTKTGSDVNGRVPEVMMIFDIPNFNTTVNVSAFTTLNVSAGIQLDYNLNLLQNITVSHMLEHVQCGMLPAMEFRLLPETSFLALQALGLNVSASIQDQNGNITTYHLSSYDYEDVTVDAIDNTVNWLVEWVRTLGNHMAQQVLVKSPETCPGILPSSPDDDDGNNHNKIPDTNHLPWSRNPVVWLIVFVCCLCQYGLVWIAQGLLDNASENRDETRLDEVADDSRDVVISESMDEVCMNPLEEDEGSDRDLLEQSILNDMRDMDRSLLHDIRDQINQEHDEFILAERDDAVILNHSNSHQDEDENPKTLLMETRLPGFVRFILPALVIGTIVLLFSSNVSVGASVDMSITIAQKRVQLPGLFEFSLANTVAELLKAGIYPLFFLVVVFSGIWPYAKLALMLYVWTKPYEYFHHREQRLLVLDALSKFSLVDTYVLVVMLVAFRFHLEVSKALGLDVFVTPKYGFYAFLLATMLSLVLGHGMLYFHRQALALRLSSIEHQGVQDNKESIYSHQFEVGGAGSSRRNGRRRRLSYFFKFLFFLSSLSAFALLVAGFVLESFSFEFGGLAGIALGERKRSSYSLISLGAAIPGSVEDPGFAIFLLQVAYYFYAVVTPLSCLLFLFALLTYPMKLAKQRWVLVAAEIANAWSAVEVFVLSIGAALFQISTFASFIIGDRCDIINMLLRDTMGTDGEGVSCFTVEASLEPNFWYLFGGAVLNSFVVSLGLRIAHLAINERQRERLMAVATSSPSGGSDHESTLASRIYNIPVIGCMVFSNRASSEDDHRVSGREETGEDSDEDEEVQAEWTHWF